MVRLALPNKGRLAEPARTLLEDAGLDARAPSDRALRAYCGEGYLAVFARAQDIPELVADGAADAGITGWDLVSESTRPLADRLDLKFGRCRLVLAVPDESSVRALHELGARPRVATTFPRLTAAFFRMHGSDVEVVPISGAVESAPHLGIADAIVDLTSTGATMRANGLRELVTLQQSSARLITRVEEKSADAATAVTALVSTLESVVRARDQRYVMANMPRNALDRVRTVLPGLNGATVTEILNGGHFVAVHAVVPADQLSFTVAALKSLGGEGILVTRIERLVP
ncbi:MAG TPA: ATP phosphoribosyltransferase [Gemmatimonadaceae bacterium]|nr:ATP phosphoribosyltransferase [Gemmatimonadaceae bacterium]